MAVPSVGEHGKAPTTPPPFTLADIRRAIPPHCFKRSLLRSFASLAVDVTVCTLLALAATFIDHPAVPAALRWVLWPAYWFFQGAFATGIWVIAHECGHGAFSEHGWINDSVGLVFHSLLLVPYFSWKHSHRRHHQNTGSVTRDEVFVPSVKPAGSKAHPLQGHAWYRAARMAVMLVLGWPMYLTYNAAGRAYDRWASHFDPYSPIFKAGRERWEVVVSDVALAAVLSGLAFVGRTLGWAWLLKMYVIPYFVVNHWLVMITYLQHTHPAIPHYEDKEWDWLRGALATVDRSYGFLDTIFHHIADTHVAHHLFSYMPHYGAVEATAAIQSVLGDYYARDPRPVFRALWEDFGECEFVVPDGERDGVLWYTH